MSQANQIAVHREIAAGVWRATLGPGVHSGVSATGKTPQEAVSALANRFAEKGWSWDDTWQPVPETEPAKPHG